MQYVYSTHHREWIKLTSNWEHHLDKHKRVSVREMSKQQIEQLILGNKSDNNIS